MRIKKFFGIFLCFLVVLLPIKIYCSFAGNGFERSEWFADICLSSLISIVFFSAKLDTHGKTEFPAFVRNLPLATLCMAIAAMFLWNAFLFFKVSPADDLTMQYKILSIMSLSSAATLILSAFSHLRGDNFFKKFQLAAFFPIIYFIISLICFLSLSVKADAFDVAAQSFLALFFVYYSQIFIRCGKKINVIKRVVVLSCCSLATCLMAYITPSVFTGGFMAVAGSTAILYLFVSVYATLLTYECAKIEN
jgi:hypothetical protein